mmetsp:Transcript_27081/g.68290  ORF Transcript_27081/g.68290 Transcript_27081/m.68290 type:complete len:207 (-) Transcript_27081:1777-2397(-)
MWNPGTGCKFHSSGVSLKARFSFSSAAAESFLPSGFSSFIFFKSARYSRLSWKSPSTFSKTSLSDFLTAPGNSFRARSLSGSVSSNASGGQARARNHIKIVGKFLAKIENLSPYAYRHSNGKRTQHHGNKIHPRNDIGHDPTHHAHDFAPITPPCGSNGFHLEPHGCEWRNHVKITSKSGHVKILVKFELKSCQNSGPSKKCQNLW